MELYEFETCNEMRWSLCGTELVLKVVFELALKKASRS